MQVETPPTAPNRQFPFHNTVDKVVQSVILGQNLKIHEVRNKKEREWGRWSIQNQSNRPLEMIRTNNTDSCPNIGQISSILTSHTDEVNNAVLIEFETEACIMSTLIVDVKN